MKKCLLVLFSIVAVFAANAQMGVKFTTDDNDKFLKELDQFMSSNKSESNMKISDQIQKLVKAGKLTPEWLSQMAVTANYMSGRLMAPAPHFYAYLNAVVAANQAGKTDAQFADWSKFVNDVIKGQKKGDNSDFTDVMDFSNTFFTDGALLSNPSKTWKVETPDYKFSYTGDKARVSFPQTTLIAFSHNDTIYIRQTAGDYLPTEKKWEGKSGRVDWARVGLDPNKVYATFGPYSINLNNYTYTIDTVQFYYPEYFKAPVTGKLADKIVAGGDSTGLRYPRFESYQEGITIKDIAPNVSYTGSFGLYGSKVMGTDAGGEKPMLTFYAKDGKTKVLSAKSASISIKKGEELGAEKAEVSIYFGQDSIYHPQLNLVYKIPKHEVRLLRGETGLGKAKFYDSYHKHEFQTDAIFWNLDSTILNLKILSGAGKKPGVFESANYFSKEVIRKQQGVASYEPLSILKRLYESTGSRDINALDVARALDPHLTEVQAKSLFYELVENGFIAYNETDGIITVKDKALNYVLANAKKIDYDIIRINSAPQKGNDYIDLSNNNIDLKGVKDVPISDTAFVYFIPKDNSISLQKDRNMEFDGLIYAGRMDLTGKKYKFNYTPFTVDLTQVDTMRINVQDSGKVDAYGNPVLKPLRSKIENLKGLLEIDAPINKSGRTRLPQFPRLYSREKSYIYYDDSTVAKGAYNRKTFFFELEPFRLDSLNNFSGDIINWKGKLVSGGIFPDVSDSVKIQGDGSLGFKSETPAGGYPLYNGKGKYFGKFELKYEGLAADGRITYLTSDFKSSDIKLYPDSLLATTDSFTIAKSFEGPKTPAVKGLEDKIFWRPNADSMLVSSKPEKPFSMYDDGFTTFKGNLMLTPKGLHGNGTLDWDEASLTSTEFQLRTMDLAADTAALNIKTTGDKVTFKTPNVSAKVDFKTRIGDFKSNLKNIPTDFLYNQYSTNINEFKWFMDEKILDFKAPPAGPGEYFTSTRPEQKGLQFLGKRAIYYLTTSKLRVEQVPEIRVADASVVPDSGLVIIEAEAKMQQLHNAVIIADTINKKHKIEHATVDIYSKNELKAVGDYTYVTKGIKETINFGDIGCKKVTVGVRKNKEDQWQLTAKSSIGADKNFVLYPDVKFNGDVTLTSVNPNLYFKGYSKIDFKHPKANTTDFFISQDIKPDTLWLQFDTAKNSNGNAVMAGINLSQADDTTFMYTSILAPKHDNKDNALFKAIGVVAQDKNGEYVLGSERKIRDNTRVGNVMRYNDKTGIINAEGKFSLGANFGIIKNMTAGYAEVKLDSLLYKFDLSFGLDMKMDDKMQERFEFYMAGDNVDLPDISYDSEKQKKVIYELANEKDDKKMLEEFDQTGLFNKRPKGLTHNLVFNDVMFVFDTTDHVLRSTGKIGVAMVGKKVINKKLDGYIEVQYKGGYDVITIYLQTGTKDWFYFEYRPGTLGLLSSYDDYNNMIGAVAPEKRKIKGPNDKFYIYTIGSSTNKAEFISYMKDKAAGIYHPRFEPQIETLVPLDSTGNYNTSPDDSDSYEQQIRQQEQPQLTPEQQEIMKQQNEINQMEQMRMNNQSILSGPPPGRDKPKEEPKQEDAQPKDEPEKEEPKAAEPPAKEEPQNAAPANAEPQSSEPAKVAPKQDDIQVTDPDQPADDKGKKKKKSKKGDDSGEQP